MPKKVTKKFKRPPAPALEGVNPNDRCICGSGKKFKRCCRDAADKFEQLRHIEFPGEWEAVRLQMAEDGLEPFASVYKAWRRSKSSTSDIHRALIRYGERFSTPFFWLGYKNGLLKAPGAHSQMRSFFNLDVEHAIFQPKPVENNEVSIEGLTSFMKARLSTRMTLPTQKFLVLPESTVFHYRNKDEPRILDGPPPFHVYDVLARRVGSQLSLAALVGWALEEKDGRHIPANSGTIWTAPFDHYLQDPEYDQEVEILDTIEGQKLWKVMVLADFQYTPQAGPVRKTLLGFFDSVVVTLSDDPIVMRNIDPELEDEASTLHEMFKVNPLFRPLWSFLWVGDYQRLMMTDLDEVEGEYKEQLQEKDEYISEVEDEYLQAEERRAELVKQIEMLQQEIEHRDQRLVAAEHEATVHRERAKRTVRIDRRADAGPDRLTQIIELPETATEALKKIEKMFPDRLVFLSEAHDSMDEAAINSWDGAVTVVWRVLMHMAMNLWPLYFGEKSGDIEKAFEEKSGLDLAITESKETKAHPRLKEIRKRRYGDEDINCFAHVKFGNKPPRILRVHYWVDSEKRLLVIGHCGDHLESAKTRRL